MNQKLLDQLKQEFPTLWTHDPNPFIRDGWFKLIHGVCAIIHSHLEYFPIEVRNQLYFTQVKEKFGGLRVHMSHHDEFIDGVTTMAEYLSESTCELCGNIGTKRNIHNYVQTLCDPCNAQEIEAADRRIKEYEAKGKK